MCYNAIEIRRGEIMKSILIVEDDVDINNMLRDLLLQAKYDITSVFDGVEAIKRIHTKTYDLILLDYMLPGKSGNEVLDVIRALGKTPVITISALDNKGIVIEMLRRGANDYVTKPFDTDELLARIEVQLRDAQPLDNVPAKDITYKGLLIKEDEYDGFINDAPLELSKTEYEILKLLMGNPQKVFTKNNIYQSVWQEAFYGDENTINVHISNIRSKIGKKDKNEPYIKTVWGIGFKMHE